MPAGRPTSRDVHVNRPLTNVSVAYKNSFYIATEVFPEVTVQKQSDQYWIWSKEAWFRLRSGRRAPGGKAPEVDYGVTTGSYICLNESLAKGIPDEVRDNADAPLRPDVTATNFVTDGLMLTQENRVAALIGACANWASASNPSTQWDNDSSDAWGDISNLVYEVEGQIARPVNIMVIGRNAWKTLRNHPDLVDRVKYQREGGKLVPADLMGWFDVEKVLIGKARKDTSIEGQSASMTDVWGDYLWVGYVTPNPAIDEPSAGYCFRWGTRSISRYREDTRHRDLVEAEEWVTEKITASDAGGGMYNVSASG